MDHRRLLDCERGLPVVMNPQKNSAVPNRFFFLQHFIATFSSLALIVDGFSLTALVALFPLSTAGGVLSKKNSLYASCPALNDEITRQD